MAELGREAGWAGVADGLRRAVGELPAGGARDIALLAGAQALGTAGLAVVVLCGGLVGAAIAPSPGLAALPPALHILATAAATVPVALLMRRLGRRAVCVAAALAAALAAVMAADAVVQRSFTTFCLALMVMGVNGACVQQYRFAAAERAPARYAGAAVSAVLCGGMVAGLIGSALVRGAPGVVPHAAYAGAFMALALCYGLSAALLTGLGGGRSEAGEGVARPLHAVVLQPRFLVAVLAGAAGFGVMGLMMTATPLEMVRVRGFPLEHAAWVIQSHFIAMFLPSVLSGPLVDRLGAPRMLVAGAAALLLCVAGSALSSAPAHYWGTLLLLGVGWNLLYVGGTVLVRAAHRPSERLLVQASNDGALLAVQGLASLAAGPLLLGYGWLGLNLATLAPLAPLAAALLLLWRLRARAQRDERFLRSLLRG